MKFTLALHFLIFVSVSQVLPQVIQGRIFDATNNEGLPGAVILNTSDSSGTMADLDGRFTLEVKRFPVSLLISHIGYEPRKLVVNNAQENVSINLKAKDQHLNEVVVSATNFNRKIIDIPASVHSIGQVELQRNDVTLIMPVINRMPGVFMETGSLNTNRLSIRGVGSRTPYGTNRVRAYFNEIPLTSGEGESTIEDIDLHSLERVEIIKGPASSIYGAGLGGTVNLIASIPEYQQSKLSAGIIAGSFGLRNTQLSVTHSTENGSLYIGLNDIYSKGYRENSEYSRRSATVSSIIYGGEDFSFSFLGSFINLKSFIPSSINKTAFQQEPQSAAVNWEEAKGYEAYNKAFSGFSTEYNISDKLTNYSSVFISFRDADEPRPFDILLENTVSAGVRSRFDYQRDLLTKPVVFQAGAEIFGDWHHWSTYENLYQDFPGQGSISGAILSNNKERRQYYNLFVQFRWEALNRLTIEGGINYNKTDYQLTDLYYVDNINQSGKYGFEPVFSPRLGIVYNLINGWNTFFTISHGYSMPSLEETLTPEGLINTDIKPETGTNYEAGTKGRWLNNKLYGEISIYRTYISNLLVAERIGPDQYIGVNAGKTLHDGLELMLNYQWSISGKWQLEPFVSITATDYKFSEYFHRETDFSGKYISGFPKNILNLGFDLTLERGFFIYGDYRFVDEAPLNDENTLFNDSYSLVTLKTGYSLTFSTSWQVDFSLGVNNLTNEKYASMILINAVGFGNSEPRYFYPGLPRNYYGSIKLNYIF